MRSLSFVIVLSALMLFPFGVTAFAAKTQDDVPAVEEAQPDAAADADALSDETEEALSRDAACRMKIKEAELLFQEAARSYKKGNKDRAGDLFSAALVTLSSAGVTADAYYGVKDDFAIIFGKLCSAAGAPGAGSYPIPLDSDNELVQKYLKLFSEGPAKERIRKALERSGRYREMIKTVLKENDLPAELVYLPVVESLYSNNDLSRAGALGLWQFMPHQGRNQGLKINYWIDERKDPEKATRAAARYLKQLYFMLDNWHLALAAYNRGENGLVRDLRFSNATNIGEMSERKAVPRETQAYVPQFIAVTLIGENPEKYGYKLEYEKPVPADEVALDKVADLKIIAKCAGTTVDAIRQLNPALKAWCTPQNYPDFTLKLPAGTKESFLAALAQEKDLNPSRGFIKYRVAKGDSLSVIAKKFGTTVSAIREDNRIKNPRHLRINQTLVIRPGRKYFTKAR